MIIFKKIFDNIYILAKIKPNQVKCDKGYFVAKFLLALLDVPVREGEEKQSSGLKKRKIQPSHARPRYCTSTCCTPCALPHHNKL